MKLVLNFHYPFTSQYYKPKYCPFSPILLKILCPKQHLSVDTEFRHTVPTLISVSCRSHRCSNTDAWIAGSSILFTSPRAPSILLHRITDTSGNQPWHVPPHSTLLNSSREPADKHRAAQLCHYILINRYLILLVQSMHYRNELVTCD